MFSHEDQDGAPPPRGAQVFPTREPRDVLRWVAGLAGLCVGLGIAFLGPVDPPIGIFVGSVLSVLLFRGLPGKKTSIVVGADGVLVRSQFVPYSNIRGVQLEGRKVRGTSGTAGDSSGQPVWAPRQPEDLYVWRFSLERVSRAPLFVKDLVYDARAPVEWDDVRRTPLVKAIEEALAAWRSARESPDLEQEDLVSRGDASGAQWVDKLRGLGSGASSTYRIQPSSQRALSRLLTSQQAKPSARAAAAIVLAESGDPTSRQRLRLAAESMADPRLRIALDRVAEETATDALVDALEALEAAERNAWGRPKTRR